VPERHASDGQHTESAADDDILLVFETSERPFHGASEIAERFNLSHTRARRRLESLSDDGELEAIQTSDRQTVWYHERELIVLREEAAGYSAHDTTTGVTSAGDTRPEALRNLAEAIEVSERTGTHDAFAELDDAFAELDDAFAELDGDRSTDPDADCTDGNPFDS